MRCTCFRFAGFGAFLSRGSLGSCFPVGWQSVVAWLDDAVFVGVDGDLHSVPQAKLGEDADDVALVPGSGECLADRSHR